MMMMMTVTVVLAAQASVAAADHSLIIRLVLENRNSPRIESASRNAVPIWNVEDAIDDVCVTTFAERVVSDKVMTFGILHTRFFLATFVRIRYNVYGELR